MTQVKVLLAGLIAALAVGGLAAAPGQAGQATSPSDRGIVIAHDETGTGDNTENSGNAESSGEDSAKMGKEEGTHTGPDQGVTPEDDTEKVDQPERRNPTTGGEGDDSKE